MSDRPEIIPARRALNVRSVLLGLLGVLFICGLTPYNDFVLANTFLVGNFMPVGLLLFFGAVVMLVNAPLWRWRPRWAFGTGELAVAMGMTLVSCTLPSSGLMRYLPAHLANVHYHADANVDYARVVADLNLPEWAFPTFEGTSTSDIAKDDVVKYYRNRIPLGEEGAWGRIFRAWVRPAIGWGALLACIYGAVLFASVIVRRQWVENERLAFPLASVYLSLIEAPAPGRSFNALFRNWGFWIAAASVFTIHAFNGLHRYDAEHWPELPISFDLGNLFTSPPWSYMTWGFKSQTLYFCVIGFAFFIQSNVAFSLWFFYAVLLQLTVVQFAAFGGDFNSSARQTDLWLGALIPFAMTVLWIGRGQWAVVWRQMIRRGRADDPRGRYLPYALAGWGLLACLAGTVAWLLAVGVTFAGAVVIVAMLGLFYLVLARIVAETGLIFVQLSIPLDRPWVYALQDLPASMATRPTGPTSFWSGMIGGTLAHDVREALPPFAIHALRVTDMAAFDDAKDDGGGRGGKTSRGHGYGVFATLVLALIVGFLVAGASTLWAEYSYGSTLDRQPQSPLNGYGVNATPNSQILGPTLNFQPPNNGPKESHSHPLYLAIGAGVSGALSLLRLRYLNWPLHPIGLLTCFSYPAQRIWFSIFLGWLAKVIIVRFGGSDMFKRARPLFIGLILGEAAAASFWLIVSIIRNSMGYSYEAINLLPT